MAASASSTDNQTTKNALIATGAVILILIAIVVIVKVYKSTQPNIIAHSNLPFGSGPKGAYLKQQKGLAAAGGAAHGDPSGGGE